MVIAATIKFGDTITSDQIANFPNVSFEVGEDGIYPIMYEWYQRSGFDTDLDEMYEYCKSEKIKPRGAIYAVKREGEEGDPQQLCIKLDAKGYEYIEGSFTITMKKDGPKKKALKLEDKIALFREYWNRNHRVPNPSEVFKDFKVGAFYKTCLKNSETMEMVNEIVSAK